MEFPPSVAGHLDGKDLCGSVFCLGHNLHQLTNMARARFIDKNVELKEELSFANEDQILKAVKILCSGT